MTNCRSIQDKLLTEYIDGLLSAEELAETNRHLDSCTQCRNALATIRQAETTLRAAPVFTPPDHCWANIREQIEASVIPEPEPERPHPWNAWLEYLFGQPQHAAWTALATVVILAGATASLLPGTRHTNPSTKAGAALLATLEDRDQITSTDEIDLNTNTEYFINYKEEAI